MSPISQFNQRRSRNLLENKEVLFYKTQLEMNENTNTKMQSQKMAMFYNEEYQDDRIKMTKTHLVR